MKDFIRNRKQQRNKVFIMEWSLSNHQAIVIDSDLSSDPSFKTLSTPIGKEGFVRRCFPTGFKHELIELIKFSLPIVVTYISMLFLEVAGPLFVGHVGKYVYDSASMGMSLGNVIGLSVGIGLIAACDTLFSQSYGSTNKQQVGIYLQTAIYMCSLAVIVSWAILLNTNNILLVLGQDSVIAKYTEDFIFIFMPSLYCLFIYSLLSRYLQVQGKVVPSMIAGVIANGINAILQYVLIYVCHLDLLGSAAALLVAYIFVMSSLFGYLFISKVYTETWGGWSRESLKDWGKYMKLGLSSVFMLCVELWTIEAAMFLVGSLGTVELGANSVISQIWVIYSSLSLGIGSACAYRVGRYLGSKNIPGAITTARVSLIVSYIIAIILTIITFSLQQQLPKIFTSDQDVIELATQLIPLLALVTFFGSAKNICSGVVRGTGKQVLGGVIAFVAFIICGLPIGIALLFLTELGAAGFWWGLSIGFVIQSFSLLIIVFTMNWEREMEDAQIRAKVLIKKMTESAALLEDCSIKEQKKASYQTISNKQVCHTETYWKKLTIWRLLIVLLCLGIFAFGVLCRFVIFIPPPVNSTSSNNQTQLRMAFSNQLS